RGGCRRRAARGRHRRGMAGGAGVAGGCGRGLVGGGRHPPDRGVRMVRERRVLAAEGSMTPAAVSRPRGGWVGRTGRVLDGVDVEVIPGEVVAVVGASASGKTTLLRVAAGITRAHAGQARVGSWEATDSRARRIVGYAPQDPAWLAAFTVRELLEYWGRF